MTSDVKVDTANTDPKHWEKVLATHKLDAKQLRLDEDAPSLLTPTGPGVARKKTNVNKDFAQLFRKMDGQDPFMTGHQIKKIRTGENHPERETPNWTANNAGIQKVIETAFPKWRTQVLQRKRAARWVRVIYLFYRMGMARPAVSEEMKISQKMLHDILKRIRRVASGFSSHRGLKKLRKTAPPSAPSL